MNKQTRIVVDRVSELHNERHMRADGHLTNTGWMETQGRIEVGGSEIDFSKYFVSNRTAKKRKDFVALRLNEAPPVEESFERFNRAAHLGKRAVRQSRAIIGAKLTEDATACDIVGGGCRPSSTNYEFTAETPLSLADLAEIDIFDIDYVGRGFNWARILNRKFTVFISNPDTKIDSNSYSVFVPTESPRSNRINPNHTKWDYADALLTPTHEELPGILGSIRLRLALVQLTPAHSTEIIIA